MGHLVKMKATKAIKQRAKALAEPEPAPAQQWAEWEWPPLEKMRPYDVAWLASEVIGQLHTYAINGTLGKEYSHFFHVVSFELENMLDFGVLGYSNGDPAPTDCGYAKEDEPSAS